MTMEEKSPRILFVEDELSSNQGLRYYNVQTVGLAKALSSQGWNTAMILGSLSDQDKAWLMEKISTNHVKAYSIRNVITIGPLHFPPRLWSLMRVIHPDIIQVGDDLNPQTALCVAFGIVYRIPVIGYQGVYDNRATTKQNLALLWIYDHVLGEFVRRNMSHFIAKTSSSAAYLFSKHVNKNKVTIIPVGTDAPSASSHQVSSRVTETLPPGCTLLLNVGRLTPLKNQENLILAMSEVLKHVPNAVLLVIGHGPLETSLRSLIHKLGIEDNVRIVTDPIPNDEMSSLYSRAAMSVMPSKYEIFGMAVLESLYYGKPVVAVNTGGPADMIENGKSGILLAGGDPGEIARGIMLLLADDVLLRQMSEYCRQTSINRYDWKLLALRFSEVYGNVMKVGGL